MHAHRNKKRNPLKQIDLHGLQSSEAIEYAEESLKTLKDMLSAGDITPGGDGCYLIQIITVS